MGRHNKLECLVEEATKEEKVKETSSVTKKGGLYFHQDPDTGKYECRKEYTELNDSYPAALEAKVASDKAKVSK